MTYKDLVEIQPRLLSFADEIPNEIDGIFTLKKLPAHTVICNKGAEPLQVGVLLTGCFRILSELETGDVFVIEKQVPVSFIGAIACLANASEMPAKYETTAECEIAYIPKKDFEYWLKYDSLFLWKVSAQIVNSLQDNVYTRFAEHLFLSPMYLVLRYIITEFASLSVKPTEDDKLEKTRQQISEELGISLKTVNRTITALAHEDSISICRGKITLSSEQILNSRRHLDEYKHRSRNGQQTGLSAVNQTDSIKCGMSQY